MWAESPGGLPTSLAAGLPPTRTPRHRATCQVKAVSPAQMRAQIAAWRVTAVVAVAARNSVLGDYLIGLLGPPSVTVGDVLAWRT